MHRVAADVLGCVFEFLCPLVRAVVAAPLRVIANVEKEMEEDDPDDAALETIEEWLDVLRSKYYRVNEKARWLLRDVTGSIRINGAPVLLQVCHAWHDALLHPTGLRGSCVEAVFRCERVLLFTSRRLGAVARGCRPQPPRRGAH